MAIVKGEGYKGPLTFDLSDVKDDIVDLPPGAMARLRHERDGYEKVEHELAVSMPTVGVTAGIAQEPYTRILDKTARIARIRAHRQAMEKAVEVLLESEAKYTHEREDDLSALVDSIRSVAHRSGDATFKAAFEETLRYAAQTALKAVKTRLKNAAIGTDEDPQESDTTAPKATTTTAPATVSTSPAVPTTGSGSH